MPTPEPAIHPRLLGAGLGSHLQMAFPSNPYCRFLQPLYYVQPLYLGKGFWFFVFRCSFFFFLFRDVSICFSRASQCKVPRGPSDGSIEKWDEVGGDGYVHCTL